MKKKKRTSIDFVYLNLDLSIMLNCYPGEFMNLRYKSYFLGHDHFPWPTVSMCRKGSSLLVEQRSAAQARRHFHLQIQRSRKSWTNYEGEPRITSSVSASSLEDQVLTSHIPCSVDCSQDWSIVEYTGSFMWWINAITEQSQLMSCIIVWLHIYTYS